MDSNRAEFFRCFRPLFIPLFATGCLSFHLNAKHELKVSIFTKLYTNLVRIVAIGCKIGGMIMKLHSKRFSKRIRDMSPLVQVLLLIELTASMITFIEVGFIMQNKKDIHVELFEQAYALDKALSKEFGVNFNYPKASRKIIIYVSVVIVYCGIYDIIYITSLDQDWRIALIALGYVLCNIGPVICSYAHICAMDFMRIRFRLFQKMFKIFFRLSPNKEQMRRRSVLSLINHYEKYCGLIKGINNVYGQVALSIFFYDFTQTTSIMFVLCHKALESKSPLQEYIFVILFLIPRLMKIIYTAVYSRLAVCEYKACCHIIATYDDHYPIKELKQNIDEFILWTKHNNCHFTMGKALKSNFGLAYSFFQAIGNYVLILIQLKLQETSIEDRLGERINKNIHPRL